MRLDWYMYINCNILFRELYNNIMVLYDSLVLFDMYTILDGKGYKSFKDLHVHVNLFIRLFYPSPDLRKPLLPASIAAISTITINTTVS